MPYEHTYTDLHQAQEQPIGCIEYLAPNGTVVSSVEYTDAERFAAAIKDDAWYGVPLCAVVYRNQDGQTIPLDFLKRIDPVPLRILDYAEWHKADEKSSAAPEATKNEGKRKSFDEMFGSIKKELDSTPAKAPIISPSMDRER